MEVTQAAFRNINFLRFCIRTRQNQSAWIANRIAFIRSQAEHCSTRKTNSKARERQKLANKETRIKNVVSCLEQQRARKREVQSKQRQHNAELNVSRQIQASAKSNRVTNTQQLARLGRWERSTRKEELNNKLQRQLLQSRQKYRRVKAGEENIRSKKSARSQSLRERASLNYREKVSLLQSQCVSSKQVVTRLGKVLERSLKRLCKCNCTKCSEISQMTSEQRNAIRDSQQLF